MIYTFICDPDDCDTLIEVHIRDGMGFPSGEIKMICPCGKRMQYISLYVDVTKVVAS